jgi:hypothetical protein
MYRFLKTSLTKEIVPEAFPEQEKHATESNDANI